MVGVTGLHIESRPFPGHVPAPAPDLTKTAAGALAAARRNLGGPAEHPPECRCSVWCRDEWTYHAGAIGECVAGDGPARSTDPEGRVRHPTCEVPG